MDGSIVIDLSNFKQISVDSNTYIATIGPGNRLGDIALGLNNEGRALPHGSCPYVGVGGHIGRAINQYIKLVYFYLFIYSFMKGHGGFGITSRKWGLALDTVVGLDVVLANGTIAKVSQDNYPDLFFVSIETFEA